MRTDIVRKIDRESKLRAKAELKRGRRLAKSAERKRVFEQRKP
jgi:hypothetical protein